uniref:Uncharacterized protein n=1 Tax=Vitis vinifera TaxID=29760 RepID=A5BD03_VITVI|nr:hypothetical protein VITISV_028323 [Vitis vinifera]
MVEAFGTVYKGIVPSGSGNSVAEKKLEKVVGEDEKEFKAEVNVIGQLTIRIKDTSCVTVVRVNTDYCQSCKLRLGKLLISNQTRTLTGIRGTMGYIQTTRAAYVSYNNTL